MNERIARLAAFTMAGELYPQKKHTDYDPEDLFLPHVTMSAKRAREYMMNQEPILYEESAFTGHLEFDGSVEGDIFRRSGHENFGKLCCHSKEIIL